MESKVSPKLKFEKPEPKLNKWRLDLPLNENVRNWEHMAKEGYFSNDVF
jgi:hypothetical protein